MENMTNEEIKAMVGTEFIYVFEDRSEIPAIVAAFDPNVAFTAVATNIMTNDGFDTSDRLDENGNFCVIGYTKLMLASYAKDLSFTCRSIKHLGYYRAFSSEGFGLSIPMGADPSCSF